MAQDFSVIGRALASPVRSTMVNLLMDGSQRPAGELARVARVSASTASEHLAILGEAGLVVSVSRGRQRFYGLTDASVARAMEAIGEICPPAAPVGLRQTREQERLAQARLCYDHLAGRLGVALTAQMVADGWLSEAGLAPTELGAARLAAVGVDLAELPRGRRPLTRECHDWTERQVHVAGVLGARLAEAFLDHGWVTRHDTGRGLNITRDGCEALQTVWGIDSPGLIEDPGV